MHAGSILLEVCGGLTMYWTYIIIIILEEKTCKLMFSINRMIIMSITRNFYTYSL